MATEDAFKYTFSKCCLLAERVRQDAEQFNTFATNSITSQAVPYTTKQENDDAAVIIGKLHDALQETVKRVRELQLAFATKDATKKKPVVTPPPKPEPKKSDAKPIDDDGEGKWVKVPDEDKIPVSAIKVCTLSCEIHDIQNVIKQGILTKCGGSHQTWKKRFFVLAGNKLYYYKSAEDQEPVGVIPFDADTTVQPLTKTDIIIPSRRNYQMVATNDPMRMEWMIAVQSVISSLISDEEKLGATAADGFAEYGDGKIVLRLQSLSENKAQDDSNEFDEMEVKPHKTTLDDFELLKVLGRGTYGKVIQAKHKGNKKIYAVKIIKKQSLKEDVEAEHTKSEIKVLKSLNHPFVVGLKSSFQSVDKLYLVMEFVAGGDLYTLLKGQAINESLARFFIAELVCAIDYLHTKNIVYRDIKTENILLDTDGHVRLTDFGLVKENVVLGHEYGKEVDWWGVGCLLYEMLTGQPPFYSPDLDEQFDNILRGEVSFPTYMSGDAKSLIKQLLVSDARNRLGYGPNGGKDVKNHHFFDAINWEKLLKKEIPPPLGFKPVVKSDMDTSNFDAEFTNQSVADTLVQDAPLKENEKFDGFTYVADNAFTK